MLKEITSIFDLFNKSEIDDEYKKIIIYEAKTFSLLQNLSLKSAKIILSNLCESRNGCITIIDGINNLIRNRVYDIEWITEEKNNFSEIQIQYSYLPFNSNIVDISDRGDVFYEHWIETERIIKTITGFDDNRKPIIEKDVTGKRIRVGYILKADEKVVTLMREYGWYNENIELKIRQAQEKFNISREEFIKDKYFTTTTNKILKQPIKSLTPETLQIITQQDYDYFLNDSVLCGCMICNEIRRRWDNGLPIINIESDIPTNPYHNTY